MSEGLMYNPQFERPAASADGPEGAFFDPNDLPPIDEIDLNPIKKSGKRDFGAPLGSSTIDQKKVVRYLNAAAEGSLDEESFDNLYEIAAKKAIDGEMTAEHFMAVSEALEINKPRVTALLDRVRSEGLFLDAEFVAINRVTLLFAGARMVAPKK